MRRPTLKKISRAPRALRARLSSTFREPKAEGHVLMLHTGRSGTTLLGDMIDQHPEVFWDGEVIEKLLHKTSQKETIGIDHLPGRFNLHDIIKHIRKRMKRRAGGNIYGFEIQDYHLRFIRSSLDNFISELLPMGFNKFVFVDRNPIRKIASHIIATETNRWHISQTKKSYNPKIHINPDRIYIGHSFSKLTDAYDQIINFRSEAISLLKNTQFLNLDYDSDLSADPMVASAKMCMHLGIPEHSPKIKFSKTADSKLSSLIANYSEIENALKRSGHLAEDECLDAY